MTKTLDTANIQVRIDPKTKEKARKTLDSLGLDLSSAIKIFLKSVISTQSIPFEIRTRNGFTRAQETQILKEVSQAEKEGKDYKNYDDMASDILGDCQN